MAQSYALVAVALLLFVAATPTAHGVLPLPPLGGSLSPLSLLNITTGLCCSTDGNCNSTTPPLSGALVKLNCTNALGHLVTVGQNVTSANGTVSISVSYLLQDLGYTLNSLTVTGKLLCYVYVELPLSGAVCPVLKHATGIIYGLVNIVTSLHNVVVNGNVLVFYRIFFPV